MRGQSEDDCMASNIIDCRVTDVTSVVLARPTPYAILTVLVGLGVASSGKQLRIMEICCFEVWNRS
jgi:hypothetical protein